MDIGIIILAIIQGIAEFLPISSSAHLIIFRDLLGIAANSVTSDISLLFDIALHFGTLLAILVYFYKDFWSMGISGITKGTKTESGKLFWYIVVATIPAAMMGFLFEDEIKNIIRSNFIIIALALIGMGIILYIVDKNFEQDKAINHLNRKDAIIIGCSQIFALIPGFSRSGTTIAAARILHLDRESASKFSFYLSAPIILGAVVLSIMDTNTISFIFSNMSIFIIGFGIAFISGLLCIHFLLQYIKKHDFQIFMWYRILLGIVVMMIAIIR